MRLVFRSLRTAIFTAVCTAVVASPALADDWPGRKPITAVFPFGAGADFIARLVMGKVSEAIGQTILIDNRPGAGGAVATAYAARQKPDGYNFVFAYPGPAANFTNTFSELSYKPLEDFDYVAGISKATAVIVARDGLPFSDFAGMLDYARANPGKLSIANSGVGSIGHMLELALSDTAGIEMKLVSYKANPEVVTDMLSGSLDMSMDFVNNVYLKQIEAGTIHALAVFSEERIARLPDVPTAKEHGIDLVSEPWAGVMAPKGTPLEIIEKMNAAINAYLNTDDAKAEFAKVGQAVNPMTPEQFRDTVFAEEAKWRDLIQKYGIKSN